MQKYERYGEQIMGSFAGYYGTQTIPDEKKDLVKSRVMKILKMGGMMNVQQVKLFEKNIALLAPPKINNEKQMVTFYYNYFEQDVWESAGFNLADCEIWGGKVGFRHFALVFNAVNILLEFYSDTPCLAEIDGFIRDEELTIGWLNYLFNEHYTNSRMRDPFEFVVNMRKHGHEDDNFETTFQFFRVKHSSYVSWMRYLAAESSRFTESARNLSEDDELYNELTPLSKMKHLYKAVEKIKQSDKESDEEKIAVLKRMAALPFYDRLPSDTQSIYCEAAIQSATLPHEFLLRAIADVFHLDFWELWKTCENHDHEELLNEIWQTTTLEFNPVAPVTTAEFLRCTDDDRAYFWTNQPDNDVSFSDEMLQWLKGIQIRITEIVKQRNQTIPPELFLKTLIEYLDACGEERICAFSDMFYDFIAHQTDPAYQAATLLILEMFSQKTARHYLETLTSPDLRKILLMGNKMTCPAIQLQFLDDC